MSNDSINKTANTMLLAGIIFLLLEISKQVFLCLNLFSAAAGPDSLSILGAGYDVWYFPFQLCSTPIYLCIIYGITGRYICTASEEISHTRHTFLKSVTDFLSDYGLLGGIMALIVNDGFTSTGFKFIAIHGFIWHFGMILLSLWLIKCRNSSYRYSDHPATPAESSMKIKRNISSVFEGFGHEVMLFASLAAIAELINISLHKYGDADMFYISPYHLSSQPVFHDIDMMIGRPLGIIFYLLMITVGAAIIRMITHFLYCISFDF